MRASVLNICAVPAPEPSATLTSTEPRRRLSISFEQHISHTANQTESIPQFNQAPPPGRIPAKVQINTGDYVSSGISRAFTASVLA